MCWVFSMSGLLIFHGCQYVRALNFQDYTGFSNFHKHDTVLNMHWDAITEWFWIFQDSEYARFLHMQELHKVVNMPGYGQIIPERTVLTMAELWTCLVKVSQEFWISSGSKYARTRKMARLWIREAYTMCWICLNRCEYALIIPQHAWACLNKAEYAWICINIPE